MNYTRGLTLGMLLGLWTLGSSPNYAQRTASHSFLSTLSFDSYYGATYDWYHGYAMAARVAVPLFTMPTLDRLISSGGEDSDELFILPGIQFGVIDVDDPSFKTGVMYFAPELSLHYSLLRPFSGFSVFTGPSAEFIYANNWKKYKLVPAAGIDLGIMYRLSQHFSIAAEHRWIVREGTASFTNKADFPQKPFSHIGLVLRFSFPWKAEEQGYEEAAADYEKNITRSLAAELQLEKSAARADSLETFIASLKIQARDTSGGGGSREGTRKTDSTAGEARGTSEAYNARQIIGDSEYIFRKDPFRSGNLVNDQYLKNILIDIIDDEYVWRLSAPKVRMKDAEKIRNYFVLYNTTLSRRMILSEDENVRLFKLTCLGKAVASSSESGKRR